MLIKRFVVSSFTGLALFGLCSVSVGQTVTEADLTSVTVQVGKKERTVLCYDGNAGTARVRGDTVKFKSYSSRLKRLRKKGKKGTKKFKNLARLRKAGNRACRSLEGGTGSGTVTPTPTPTSGGGSVAETDYYDSDLNLTSLGKQAFGIASNLSPSYEEGQVKYSSKGCAAANCHGAVGRRYEESFSAMRTAVSRSPMNYTTSELSDADLADIMTYLRFGTCSLCR